ncbi:progesterone-induced-blocking factor 1-like, partial [Aplysia californica]|uniref:Progesterone-induced-blocking factor 1-like n=1 Tax=Aplysia californica TaxID=6500 RepID=A0ABM0KBJ6_APLCA
VHLARRVLQLEKTNTSLRQELQEHKSKADQLVKEVENTNNLLDQSQQPYGYLINSIRVRDGQLQQQAGHIQVLEDDLRKVSQEREELARTHNQMSLDLERLLNQKEVSCCTVSVSCCTVSVSCCTVSVSCCTVSVSCCTVSVSCCTVSVSCCTVS